VALESFGRLLPEAVRTRRNDQRLARLGEALLGYAMIAPVVTVVVTFIGYQLVRLIAISFTNEHVGMAPGSLRFVGLENYLFILRWPDFPQMVENTLILTIGAVGLELGVGMLAALALNAKLFGRAVFAAILFLPWVIPETVAVYLWRWILDPENGVLDYVLVEHLHLFANHVVFLATPLLARSAVIFVLAWRGAPFAMILFLGALQAVPVELHEAARADGANGWQRWRYVTLPQIRRVVTIVAILSTIWTIEDYTTPYSLTLGGPANSTNVVAMLTMLLGSRTAQMAEAATVTSLFLPGVAVLIVVLSRFLGQRDAEV
jgi:multiple sugar transport system permease protein